MSLRDPVTFISECCPLCDANEVAFYHRDKARDYLQCQRCDLVFVPAEFILSSTDEKTEYDKHQNTPDDEGYRTFLSRALSPILNRIKLGATGLDFGCGPGPTLSVMASESGYQVSNYDIYYANHPHLLDVKYDFITMTEVIEHVSKPMLVIERLSGCLKPGACLLIMTKRVSSLDAFASWHYKNDPTHIRFYSERTFEWLAETMGWQLELVAKDVVIFNTDAQT